MKKILFLMSLLSLLLPSQVLAFSLPAFEYTAKGYDGLEYGFINGISVAVKHGDYWSYSSWLLEQLRENGELGVGYDDPYIFASGSGGLDILLYTGAGGQSNQGVGPGGAYDFEDPVYNDNTGIFDGWWGQNDQNNNGVVDSQDVNPNDVHGPVTVDQMAAYLTDLSGSTSTIPVFYFDLNQTGSGPNLDLWGRVSIIDPTKGLEDDERVVETWDFFDNVVDGQPEYTTAYGVIGPLVGDDGETYIASANKGSGKPDFIAYAPTMDLSAFTGSGYLFVTEFHFGQEGGNLLTNGFEELFLTSLGSVERPPAVPEAATMLLFGIGLIGLAGIQRRLKK